MTLRLLAMDTATETLHLGLWVSERVDGRVGDRMGAALVRALPGGAAASASLLPAIQSLLAEAGFALKDLDALAFGHGPGAFTGLRTACSVAQGLAMGAQLPLIALDSLAAVAEAASQAGAGDHVWTAIDARMGELYAARWQRRDGGWQALDAPALHAPAAFLELIRRTPAAHAGNAWAQIEALRDAAEAPRSWAQAQPDGLSLLQLARDAFEQRRFIDPALAMPLYVRNKVAQTTAERAQGAAARAA